MKTVTRNWGDSLVYVGLCVLTLGAVFFIRVIISMAIRCAFENEGVRSKADIGIPSAPLTEKVLNKKEAQHLRKNEVIKVSVKDGLWTCPSCSEINREFHDACRKCGQEVDKVTV